MYISLQGSRWRRRGGNQVFLRKEKKMRQGEQKYIHFSVVDLNENYMKIE